MWSCITDFFTYETTKSVVVKSWTIGIINRVVQLLIIIYFIWFRAGDKCFESTPQTFNQLLHSSYSTFNPLFVFIGRERWVFINEKAYQITDTAIESSVLTKVNGFGVYNNTLMDVADYVTPTQGASVFCIITKLIKTENQVQGYCPEAEKKFKCTEDSDCQTHTNGGYGVLTGRCVPINKTNKMCEIQGWCPAEVDTIKTTPMKEVENFTILIKNSIRFPTFNYIKGNVLPSLTDEYVKKCHFDTVNNTYCPVFRVGDMVRYAQQNFTELANTGGVIGIKIDWMCDLDKSDDQCNPLYTFTRLDAMSQHNAVSPGYNFRFAKYFKMKNGTDYRTLVKAYAIRFDVLVNGNAGKFNMIPTLINMVAAFTSVGVGTVLCDIILLNFLKGAEQYKAKKFEEVSDNPLDSQGKGLYRSQLSLRHNDIMRSSDSGAFSLDHYML